MSDLPVCRGTAPELKETCFHGAHWRGILVPQEELEAEYVPYASVWPAFHHWHSMTWMRPCKSCNWCGFAAKFEPTTVQTTSIWPPASSMLWTTDGKSSSGWPAEWLFFVICAACPSGGSFAALQCCLLSPLLRASLWPFYWKLNSLRFNRLNVFTYVFSVWIFFCLDVSIILDFWHHHGCLLTRRNLPDTIWDEHGSYIAFACRHDSEKQRN